MVQLNELLSELNIKPSDAIIKQQPNDAMEDLLKLENKYGFNTKDVVNNTITAKKDHVSNDVLVDWYNTYETFKDYGGKDTDINKQSNCEKL